MNRSFFNPAWRPVAVEVVLRSGLTPIMGVLGIDNGTLKTLIQARQLSDGVLQGNTRFFNGADWDSVDLAVIEDGNSDGTADDPAWLVVGENVVTNKTLVQARLVAGGVKLKNLSFLSTNYAPQRMTVSGDISGNGREEVAVFARKRTDGKQLIQIRDFQTGAKTANYNP